MSKKIQLLIKNKISHYLTPSADGVFTVHTAGGLKKIFHKAIYKKKDIHLSWLKHLQQLPSSKKPLLLSIPSDNGGGIQRGANWGPLYLKTKMVEAKFYQSFFDLGDVKVIPHLLSDSLLNLKTIQVLRRSLFSKPMNLPVSPLSITEDIACELFTHFPKRNFLFLGGDHSVSLPLTRQWIKSNKKEKNQLGILHFDAHTDLLESRMGIKECFGTWAYHALQLLPNPKQFIQIGIRSSGKSKNFWEKKYGLTQLWSKEIHRSGIDKISQKIIKQWKLCGIKKFYISFDIDCLDSKIASATGTPEACGLELYQVIQIIRNVAEEFKLSAFDMVEVAPHVHYPTHPFKTTEPQSTLQSASMILKCIEEIYLKQS